jgi:hypothetical protein
MNFNMLHINRTLLLLALGLSLLTLSCVENIGFAINESSDQIVIVGSITTKPGPYFIKVYKAVDFYEGLNDSSNPIESAKVVISSDDGQSEVLTEIEPGLYQTNAIGIRGQVGRSYSLGVITKAGNVYQSSRERIIESAEIDSIYFQFEEKDVFLVGNITVKARSAKILVDFYDKVDQENYYNWSWNSTYKFVSNPESFTNQAGQPAPLPCSFFGCNCCMCWLTSEEQNDLELAQDRLFNGKKVEQHLVATIPLKPNEFQFKHYVNVSQKSLSKDAYDFWKQIKEQKSATTIFATPPAKIKGNIININNPGEDVWGYFSASDVKTKSFFIYPHDIPATLYDFSVINNDCRTVPNATNQQPSFWQ